MHSPEGSTKRLIQLCLGYFISYTITGITVKYFMGSVAEGYPGLRDVEFLVYSTLGGSLICLVVVFLRGWYRSEAAESMTHWGPFSFPSAWLYIIPSGAFTAVVIPTTTMMYMLPISVMVAMVIMRASVIVISRIVDAIQIAQGILDKKVYWQENVGVLFALVAAGTQLYFVDPKKDFDFVHSPAAVGILSSYIVAYAFRIYIMNYYKNTRAHKTKLNNTWFFSIEQISATVFMIAIAASVYFSPEILGWNAPKDKPVAVAALNGQASAVAIVAAGPALTGEKATAIPAANPAVPSMSVPATPAKDSMAILKSQINFFRGAFTNPNKAWGWAILAGTAYGMVAFFSVFIFMFKGRTATFAGLVNRLTSLVAGTASTLAVAIMFGGHYPKGQDWASLFFILVAVAFLTRAEKRRVNELIAEHDLPDRRHELSKV